MRRWLAVFVFAFLLSALCAGPIGCRNTNGKSDEDLQDRLPLTAPDLETG